MKILVPLLLTLAAFAACKKKDERCWQLIDNFGNEMQVICGRTESEMLEDYPACSFYLSGGKTSCWMVNGHFIKDQTEAAIQNRLNCFGGGTASKVDCNYCGNWYLREKHLHKPSSQLHYSTVTYKLFCGDTVATLYHGREVILRNTPDSLISVQFSNNGQF